MNIKISINWQSLLSDSLSSTTSSYTFIAHAWPSLSDMLESMRTIKEKLVVSERRPCIYEYLFGRPIFE